MLKQISLWFLDAYQKHGRVVFVPCCRFVPSCSEYAKQAICKYGFFRGMIKATLRLLRCHPFSGSWGHDPLI